MASLFPPGLAEARLHRYLVHWNRDPTQVREIDRDAITTPTEEERKARQAKFDQIGQDYYDVVTPMYEQGWGQRFHFTPLTPNCTLEESHEHYTRSLASMAGLKPGMRVIDIGCGIGGPARDMARITGAHITGVTNSAWHVQRGNQLSKDEGLQDKVQLVRANFLTLPFPDESFDAAYGIEALCYAPDPTELYQEIKRVLKPGAPFTFADWVMTEKFNEENEEHRKVRSWIEFGNGLTRMATVEEKRDGLKKVGFEVLGEENMAYRSAPVPWWYAPAGSIWSAWKIPGWAGFWRVFTMSPIFHALFVRPLYHLLVFLGVEKKELLAELDLMWYCCRSAGIGGRLDIFTPMYVFTCRKPSGGKDGEKGRFASGKGV
ncbi:S-adenosyl-L-methionine-dependent methyltransferase [Cercophora newfieldiana]|uniref:Sterol 24-C-methyltransferase n=1 Tax=Cercophora newfieldiana TaxID=92897 RepID=A0AA39Y3R4_9PEZI|nr:S-adenosyl-L-methionine-dependent methyltransferase [Cercophora newfieldiana]